MLKVGILTPTLPGEWGEWPSGEWDEWPSGLYSLRQVTEVKLGRVRSNSGWVISEA